MAFTTRTRSYGNQCVERTRVGDFRGRGLLGRGDARTHPVVVGIESVDDDGGREASDRARGDAPRAGEPKTTTTTGRRARGAIDDGKITECEWESLGSSRDATRRAIERSRASRAPAIAAREGSTRVRTTGDDGDGRTGACVRVFASATRRVIGHERRHVPTRLLYCTKVRKYFRKYFRTTERRRRANVRRNCHF